MFHKTDLYDGWDFLLIVIEVCNLTRNVRFDELFVDLISRFLNVSSLSISSMLLVWAFYVSSLIRNFCRQEFQNRSRVQVL